MPVYVKQPWQTGPGYAASQGPSGYQQQPPGQPQQAWSQQQYPPQPGSYQPSPSYAPQQGGYQAAAPSFPSPQNFSAPPLPSYGSAPRGQYDPPPFSQRPYFSAPPPQNQYGAPPPGQWSSPPHGGYGPPPPQQQQLWGLPQGQGGSEKRHSVCFKFTGTSETILNSQMHDPYGKTSLVVSSDKKHTTVRASDGTTLVLIDWDHSSPVMYYQGKKLKCKEWLVWERAKGGRVFQHAGKGYRWTARDEKACLESVDRPGHYILIASDPTGPVEVEAFQEVLVVPGLLEAAIVGLVIMGSDHELGDNSSGNSALTSGYPALMSGYMAPTTALIATIGASISNAI